MRAPVTNREVRAGQTGTTGKTISADGAITEIDFLPPVLTTAKIVCVGLNYADHAAEVGVALPDQPMIFAKLPNSLTGHRSPIVLSPLSEQVDFEAELGGVVGRRARGVSKEEALAHVFGYTCVNDVLARHLQHGDQQWTPGSRSTRFAPRVHGS